MDSALTFLQQYHDDGESFWNEVCAHYPRNQAAVNALVSQWISLYYTLQVKFKQTMSARKVMCTVFWNRLIPIPGGRLLRHRDTKVGPTVYLSQFRRKYVKKWFNTSVNGSRETYFVDALRNYAKSNEIRQNRKYFILKYEMIQKNLQLMIW